MSLDLKPPPSFEDFVEVNKIEETTYPYARKGPKLLRKARSWTINAIVAVIIWALIRYIAVPYYYVMVDKQPVGQTIGRTNISLDNLFETGANILLVVRKAAGFIAIAIAIMAVIKCISYISNVLKRQQAFEREVYRNDKQANRLRAAVLKQHDIERRIREFKEEEKRRKQSVSGTNNTYQRSLADDDKLQVLQTLKNLEVYINTRQSVLGEEIERMHRIEVELPSSTEQSEQVQSMIEKYGVEANRITASNRKKFDRTQFPTSPIIYSDGTRAAFPSSEVVEDKYAKPAVQTGSTKKTVKYEPTVGLDLFVDRSKDIAKRSKRAKKYLEGAGENVENILASNKVSARLTRVEPGNTSGMLVYEMAGEVKSAHNQSLIDPITMAYTKAATLQVSGKEIFVTVPLPEEAQAKIDMKTLMEEMFF